MKLKVPIVKDSNFSIELLNAISKAIGELSVEHGELPDQIIFSGSLGREIFEFLNEKDWQLDKFHPTLSNGRIEQIIVQYSKPLDQVKDNFGTTFDEPLNGKTIKGIVSPEMMQKVLGTYATPAFRIEKKITPTFVITLHR